MQVYSQLDAPGSDELDLRCPPLPQTLMQAVELSNQADPLELEQAVQLVEKDPVAITRLLKIVNSAYYAQRGTITSIPRAVLILGPSSVVGIVMSMSMMELRTALDKTTAAPFVNLVRHSVATAFLAQRLIQHDPAYDSEKSAHTELAGAAFTAGMLHDLGKLVLLYNHPGKAVAFYVSSAGLGPDPLEAERKALGFDHVAAGSFLTRSLNLPEALTEAISYHHDPLTADGKPLLFKKLLYAIICASKVASSMGYAFDRPLTWEQCMSDPVWSIIIDEGVYEYASAPVMIEEMVDAKARLESYLDSVF
ncbi:MAG TPA: HDOD domain-containing protein [Rhodothermales bacterium]|nr:HDOD domain-containing protein [Rhodothermales bacterium]